MGASAYDGVAPSASDDPRGSGRTGRRLPGGTAVTAGSHARASRGRGTPGGASFRERSTRIRGSSDTKSPTTRLPWRGWHTGAPKSLSEPHSVRQDFLPSSFSAAAPIRTTLPPAPWTAPPSIPTLAERSVRPRASPTMTESSAGPTSSISAWTIMNSPRSLPTTTAAPP
jgi:hypothetical protein